MRLKSILHHHRSGRRWFTKKDCWKNIKRTRNSELSYPDWWWIAPYSKAKYHLSWSHIRKHPSLQRKPSYNLWLWDFMLNREIFLKWSYPCRNDAIYFTRTFQKFWGRLFMWSLEPRCYNIRTMYWKSTYKGENLIQYWKVIESRSLSSIPQRFSLSFSTMVSFMIKKNPRKRITVESLFNCLTFTQLYHIKSMATNQIWKWLIYFLLQKGILLNHFFEIVFNWMWLLFLSASLFYQPVLFKVVISFNQFRFLLLFSH